jgi:hypothetical protein
MIALIAFVVLFVMAAGLSPFFSLVPRVAGKTVEETKAALDQAGFTPGEVVLESEYNTDRFETGRVIGLSLIAYTPARRGSVIDIKVAAGEAVAVVNGESIRAADLQTAVDNLKQANPQAFSNDPTGEREREFRKLILSGMVERLLVEQAAREQGIEVTDEQIQKQIEDMRKGYESEEKFTQSLANAGLTLESLADQIRGQLITQELLQSLEIDTDVSSKDIETFYENNKQLFPDKSLKESREQIQQIILQQRRADAYQEYVAELKANASVEILDPQLQ